MVLLDIIKIGAFGPCFNQSDPLSFFFGRTQFFCSVAYSSFDVLTLISQDTWFICVVTYATAIFSGFVIFSVLGFMSFKMNKPIEEVASQGAGLAFIIYPEVRHLLSVRHLL